MKRLFLFLFLVFVSLIVFSQSYLDSFSGTWVYEKNDTVFKVKLQKGKIIVYNNIVKSVLLGGYSLTVHGELVEDYIKPIPDVFDTRDNHADCGVYLWTTLNLDNSNEVGFVFYDMKKKHIFGKGLPANVMTLLSPDKLHWKLNEKEGLWFMLEGGPVDDASEEEERRRDEAWKLRGFSVPDDVIMIKEE